MCIAVLVQYRTDVNRHDSLRRPALWTFDAVALRTSLSYGGWLTVTNVIGPIMGYFDRFVLSHLAGASVVAYYVAGRNHQPGYCCFPARSRGRCSPG